MAFAGRNSGPPTVLVIDDETGPREALRMVLKPHFRVLTANCGEEALATLRHEKVDVITLDLRMPGFDGVTTLELIREIAPEIGVVVITGFGSRETLMDTVYLGAFSYMNKPFHVSDVLETVREALERSRRGSGSPATA
ncbi:MAG: response regulator [Candidatus Binatia bacterium]